MLLTGVIALVRGRRQGWEWLDEARRGDAPLEDNAGPPEGETRIDARPQESLLDRRTLNSLGATLDLDQVVSQVLEVATRLLGVDEAMVTLVHGDGVPLVATRGLSLEDATLEPVARLGDWHFARAIAYRYADADLDAGIGGGVVVPLRRLDREPVGLLATFWRGERRDPSAEELANLEDLAAQAGPAIENAWRFRAARALADLDPLTGLYNHRHFRETLAHEIARARRYGRNLALVVFDIDDFKAINDTAGHLAGDSVLVDVADRVRSAARSADIPCRVGGDEFAVILPESTVRDAEQFYRRLHSAVANQPSGGIESVHFSAGIAELRREDEVDSFFERADKALYRAKRAGKNQAFAEETR